MAYAIRQTQTNSSAAATTLALTWAGNTTPGNTIILSISLQSTTATVSSITDSQSNTYTKINSARNSGSSVPNEMWYAYNIAGGTTPTVTITFSASVTSEAVIREYSGLTTTDPLDKTQSGSGGLSATTSGATATTTQNNELVVGTVTNSAADATVGAGYGNFTMKTGTYRVAMEDKRVTSTGAQTATFGGGTGFTIWACCVATFKEDAGATTTSTSSSTSSTSTSTSTTSTSISTSSTSTSISTSSTSTSISTSTTVSTSTSSTSTSLSTTTSQSTSSSTSLSTSTSTSTSSTSTSTSTTVSYTTSTSSTSTSESTSTTTSQSTSTSSTSSSTSTSISTSTTTSQSTSTSSTSSSTSSTTSQSTSTTQSWTTSTSSTSTSSTSTSISTSTTTTLPHDPKVTPSIDVFEDNPRMQHIIDRTMAEIRPDQIRLDSAPNKSVVTVKSDKPRMQSKTTLSYSAVRKDTARLGHIRKNVMVRIRKK